MNDTTVIIVLFIIFICHLATIILRFKTKKVLISIASLNAIIALGTLIFFTFNIINSNPYQFAISEVFAWGIELSILIFALNIILGFRNKTYVKVFNHIGFWFHLFGTIGMLFYMFIFKMDHLF